MGEGISTQWSTCSSEITQKAPSQLRGPFCFGLASILKKGSSFAVFLSVSWKAFDVVSVSTTSLQHRDFAQI